MVSNKLGNSEPEFSNRENEENRQYQPEVECSGKFDDFLEDTLYFHAVNPLFTF